jgi:hypothetical protein
MSEQLFDVVFFGILQPGKDKDTVIQNMAALFKTETSKLTPYFAGGRKVIKGKINVSSAEKYQAALENVGLVIKIEVSETAEDKKEKETSAGTDVDISGLSMAPAGSNVIEHPTEVPSQTIGDVSGITMAEPGVDVIENPVEVPAQKIDDISNITMAEPGVDVLDHPREVIPQKIDDISDITLAEAGADVIENPKPEEKAVIPDTSELSLIGENK